MEKNIFLKDYKKNYNKHVEAITHFQGLITIEEQKLFELIQTKKQVFVHEKPTMA